MATATTRCTTRPIQPKPARKPKPATVRFTLTIGDSDYAIRPLTVDHRSGVSRLIRLRKDDGTVYHVSQHPHGAECECPDFVYRREGKDPRGCRHVRALVSIGLIEPTPPVRPAASTWAEWTDEVRFGLTADAEQAERQARFRTATANDGDLDEFTRDAIARAVEGGYLDAD